MTSTLSPTSQFLSNNSLLCSPRLLNTTDQNSDSYNPNDKILRSSFMVPLNRSIQRFFIFFVKLNDCVLEQKNLLPKPGDNQQAYALIPIRGGVPIIPSQPLLLPASAKPTSSYASINKPGSTHVHNMIVFFQDVFTVFFSL